MGHFTTHSPISQTAQDHDFTEMRKLRTFQNINHLNKQKCTTLIQTQCRAHYDTMYQSTIVYYFDFQNKGGVLILWLFKPVIVFTCKKNLLQGLTGPFQQCPYLYISERPISHLQYFTHRHSHWNWWHLLKTEKQTYTNRQTEWWIEQTENMYFKIIFGSMKALYVYSDAHTTNTIKPVLVITSTRQPTVFKSKYFVISNVHLNS